MAASVLTSFARLNSHSNESVWFPSAVDLGKYWVEVIYHPPPARIAKNERVDCLFALCDLVDGFGQPHVHSGLGIRKVGASSSNAAANTWNLWNP
jgi:hypothetical protein